MQKTSSSVEQRRDRALIMVVDDDENSRSVIGMTLKQENYRVSECSSGQEALDSFDKCKPDVVLLDVVMEGINGHEVCRRLKSDPSKAMTPILIISGFDSREERLQAIESGANDFISKPIDPKNVLLRVRNNLQIKRLHDQARDDYRRLQELERMRDNLIHMVVHDVRSPLTGLMGYLELLQGTAEEELSPDNLEILDTARNLAQIVMQMIQSILDVNLLEHNTMPLHQESANLVSIIQDALRILQPKLKKHCVDFTPEAEKIKAWCDPEATRRILTNLISNAVHYSPADTPIRITVEARKNDVLVEVKDQGSGLTAKEQEKLFQKFGFIDKGENGKKQRSSGLGLLFCKLAVEAQGGEIGVSSKPGEGSTFRFTLPRRQPRG